jgi:hypothetical protein
MSLFISYKQKRGRFLQANLLKCVVFFTIKAHS